VSSAHSIESAGSCWLGSAHGSRSKAASNAKVGGSCGPFYGECLHHKNRAFEEWKRSHDPGTLADWKRRQQEG